MNPALALKGFCMEIKQITSTHISLAKASHMAKPGIKMKGKYNPSSGRKNRFVEQLYSPPQAADP